MYKNLLTIIPVDLHRAFRVKLAKEDRTAKEFILTVIKHYVEEEDEKVRKNGSEKPSEKSDS